MRETPNDPAEVLMEAARSGVLALDTETTSLDSLAARPLFYPIAAGKGAAMKSAFMEDSAETRKALRDILLNKNINVVMHNMSYDLTILHRFVLPVDKIKAKVLDTMNMSWLYNNLGNQHNHMPHSLDALGTKFLKQGKLGGIKEIFETGPVATRIKNIVTACRTMKKKLPGFITKLEAHWKRKRKTQFSTFSKLVDANKEISAAERKEQKAKFKQLQSQEVYDKERVKRALKRRLAMHKATHDELKARQQRMFRAYGRRDAEVTLRLFRGFRSKLQHCGTTLMRWAEVEAGAQMAATTMQINGFAFSSERLRKINEFQIQPALERLEQEVYEMGKKILLDGGFIKPSEYEDFEWKTNDGKMLSLILFTLGDGACTLKEGVVETHRSKVDREKDPSNWAWYKTDRLTLTYTVKRKLLEETGVSEPHPFAQKIIELRGFKKLQEAFVTKLLKAGKRIHCQYRTFGADTGRWTCKSPNLQQIPSRHKIGKLLRSAFVAREGHVLIVADYSQVELRGIAHVTGDQNMIDEYNRFTVGPDGERDYSVADLHTKTLDSIKKNCPKELWARVYAKISNFGLSYGIGAEKFARQFQLSVAAAESLKKTFFSTYSGIADTLDTYARTWDENNPVCHVPLTTRRRFWPRGDAKYDSDMERFSAQKVRVAPGAILNTKVQGLCADILKAMLNQFYRVVIKNPQFAGKVFLIAQVHDEIVVEASKEIALKVAKLLKWCMEFPWIRLRVPILADVHIVDNWMQSKDGTDIEENERTEPIMVEEMDPKTGKRVSVPKIIHLYPEWNAQLRYCTKDIKNLAAEFFRDPATQFDEDLMEAA